MRRCKDCGEVKELSAFYRSRNRCKACKNREDRERRRYCAVNPSRNRATEVSKGEALEEYAARWSPEARHSRVAIGLRRRWLGAA